MISKRKIYKLQKEAVSIAKELKEKTHDDFADAPIRMNKVQHCESENSDD